MGLPLSGFVTVNGCFVLNGRFLVAFIAAMSAAMSLVVSGDELEGSSESATVVPVVASDPGLTSWQQDGWPLIQKFCIECHNQEFQEAEVDLSLMQSEGTASDNSEMWDRALQMIRFGAMPPEDATMPTEAERRQLADTIDRTLYKVACDLRPKAGRVTARRLNRTEYNNSIRDLFGIDFHVADDFPSDEVGGGFDNNADVLSMPAMLLEKYIDSAERVTSLVILDPKELQSTEQERSGDGIGVVGNSKTESFYGRILEISSFAWVEFDVKQSGKYRIRVEGSGWNAKRPAQAYCVYDELGMPLYAGEFSQRSGGGDSHSATFSRDLEAGKRIFIVAPLDQLPDDYDETKPETIGKFPMLDRLDENALRAGREQFGKPLSVDSEVEGDELRLMVRKVEIEGPVEFAQAEIPTSQAKILKRVARQRRGEYEGVEQAAIECLKPLMERTFRRPVDADELGRYVDLVKRATDRGTSFHRGMQIAITAMLISPHFLFRVELPEPGVEPDDAGEYRLTNLQLASRLSYFLWSSTPDDELLQAAKNGKLHDEKQMLWQIDRMLADSRASSLADEFAAQWLGLRKLSGLERDADQFGEFDAKLRDSMARETKTLFMHVLHENQSVVDLLDANYTFVDETLAKFYGLPWEQGTGDRSTEEPSDGLEFRRVSLEGTPRRGVLTHASVLTVTSYPTRTSPVQRGKWILENILGTPPPEPPPNVPELEATKSAPGATIREQLALHRANPACASCHRVMDQLGFGFENFDAIGRHRSDTQIDASGELPGGRKFNGGKELAETLKATESTKFASTVTGKLLGFSLGRELSPEDRCAIDKIVADNEKSNFRLADMVKSIVLSRPFQYFHPENKSLSPTDENK